MEREIFRNSDGGGQLEGGTRLHEPDLEPPTILYIFRTGIYKISDFPNFKCPEVTDSLRVTYFMHI